MVRSTTVSNTGSRIERSTAFSTLRRTLRLPISPRSGCGRATATSVSIGFDTPSWTAVPAFTVCSQLSPSDRRRKEMPCALRR